MKISRSHFSPNGLQKLKGKGIQLLLTLTLFSSCMVQEAEPPKNKSVTVYMDSMGENDSLLFEKFRKEEKIKVHYKIIPADSIIEILESEKYNSFADLVILHGANKLQKAESKKLFSVIRSEVMEKNIDQNYISPYKHWCALSKSPIILAYDQRVLKADTISFYNDVLQAKWKGKVALQDQRNSTLRVLWMSFSTLGGERNDAFIPQLYAQTALPKSGDDLLQIKRINSWQAQLGFIELSSLVKANQRKDSLNRPVYKNVGVIFPSQTQKGCFNNITGAGIYRYARNADHARRLLEFMISKRAQYDFSSGRAEFPVLDGIDSDPRLEKYGKFRARFVANKNE